MNIVNRAAALGAGIFACVMVWTLGAVSLGWTLRPTYPAIVYPARVVIHAPPVELERPERIAELLMQYTRGHDDGKAFMRRVVVESMVRVSE